MIRFSCIQLLMPVLAFAQVATINESVTINQAGDLHAAKITCDSVHYDHTPARVSAYLTDTSTTTTSSAGTWYFLQGVFSNNTQANYGFTGDTLQYQNGDYGVAHGDYSFTFQSDQNGTTIHCAVFLNDSMIATSNKSTYCKTANEDYGIASVWLCTMMHDDKVKIMMMSDKAGANIKAIQGSTTLHQIP